MSSAPHWTTAEDSLLRDHYPTASNAELQALFPARPLAGIRQRAHQIGVHKELDAHERGMPFDGSVIRHLSEVEKGYLAGIIDGEGCIRLERRMSQTTGAVTYAMFVRITNTSPLLMRWLEERFPKQLYLSRQNTDLHGNPAWRPRYDFIFSGNRQVRVLLREIAPYLVIKREQAELLANGYVHLPEAERFALYCLIRTLKRTS